MKTFLFAKAWTLDSTSLLQFDIWLLKQLCIEKQGVFNLSLDLELGVLPGVLEDKNVDLVQISMNAAWCISIK